VAQHPPTEAHPHAYNKGTFNTRPMTFRQTLILLASLGLTLGGIATYNHFSEQAAAHECVAKGYDADQCWEGR
jgi:hypothetical protein